MGQFTLQYFELARIEIDQSYDLLRIITIICNSKERKKVITSQLAPSRHLTEKEMLGIDWAGVLVHLEINF